MKKLFFVSSILLFVLGCNKSESEDSCSKPGSLSVYVSQGDVQINVSPSSYDFYEVEYGSNGFSKGTGITGNSLNLYGLSNGIYDVYVKGNCGGTDWSSWSDPKSFIVDNGGTGGGNNSDCSIPTNLISSEIDYCYSSLYWDDYNTGGSPAASYYEIEYGVTGFARGTGTSASTNTIGFSDGVYSKNTAYDFYVRANCGGSDFSEWSSVGSFYSSKDIKRCFLPKNINAFRNGSLIEFEFENNGDCTYQYTLVRDYEQPSDGVLETVSQWTVSGYYTVNNFQDYLFCVRTACPDGGYSAWSTTLVEY